MATALIFFTSFLIGSIPTAYLAGKYFGKIDIRQHGSGNVGATNAFRVLGKKIGLFVFLVDFLKGYTPAFFLSKILPINILRAEAVLLIGMAAILGHVFSPFLSFRGGKGIATGAGAVCAAFPLLFLLTLSSWTLILFWSRYVSLSSVLCLVVMVLSSFFLTVCKPVSWILSLYLLIAIWTHRDNLKRLFQGKEKKIG